MAEAVEQLPDLNSDHPLTADQIAGYRRDGHVLLRGVASPTEVAAYRPIIADGVERHNAEKLRNPDGEKRYGAFLQVANLWETDPLAARFTLARRFAKIAADLMGVDGVRLYHDQALFKPGGGKMTPWHQDHYYWPLDTDHTITMWMPLVEVSIEMGALTFASGSHRERSFLDLAISDESELHLNRIVEDRRFPIAVSEMAAGDATFHSGWTLHRAPPNQTDRMREVMTVIYFADGVRVSEPTNPHSPKDLARWLPGLKPGDLAASPLNPVVYRRGGPS